MHDRSSNGELSARFAMGSGHHLRGAVTRAVQPMLVLVDTPVIQCGVEETSAEVPRLAFDRGQYTFATRWASCHTIGRSDHLGPDLLDVTARRDRAWLTRFIAAPEKMYAAGDPVAVALRARYDQVRMPNLGLSESEIAVVIDYIDAQSRAARTPRC